MQKIGHTSSSCNEFTDLIITKLNMTDKIIDARLTLRKHIQITSQAINIHKEHNIENILKTKEANTTDHMETYTIQRKQK